MDSLFILKPIEWFDFKTNSDYYLFIYYNNVL